MKRLSYIEDARCLKVNVPKFVNGAKNYVLQIPITFGSITATSYTIEISGLQPEIIPQQAGQFPH